MKHGTKQFELLVRVAQSVTMSKIELFSVYFGSQRFTVHNDTTFFGEIIPTPYIMVANKEMHFHSHIRQFGDFSQETGISFGDDQPEFIPEIKHISQQINSRSLVLYTIMEDIRQKVESVEGVTAATINLVFEPEWDKDMMSEEAKLELGFL